MTEKKSVNPFINMANEAKKTKAAAPTGKQDSYKAPKPNKGFGGSSVMRKSGRGR